MTADGDALDVERLLHTESTLCARRVIELRPGAALDHEAAAWDDAIVFVAAGELEVECKGGERHRFRQGDILSLARLPILRVHNSGAVPTRLLAIWRRCAHR